jgi:hypothetical protein
MHFDFYMPLNSAAQTHVFLIIPQHQPFISIFISNYTTIQLSHYRIKNSSMTSPTIWTRRKIPKRTCHLAPPFSFLFYLPPSITQTFLQCNHSLHHPLLLFSITHKQTKLPTHAFLATTTDIFPPQACKSWRLMKTIKQKKNKTLKPVVFTLLGWLVVWSQ